MTTALAMRMRSKMTSPSESGASLVGAACGSGAAGVSGSGEADTGGGATAPGTVLVSPLPRPQRPPAGQQGRRTRPGTRLGEQIVRTRALLSVCAARQRSTCFCCTTLSQGRWHEERSSAAGAHVEVLSRLLLLVQDRVAKRDVAVVRILCALFEGVLRPSSHTRRPWYRLGRTSSLSSEAPNAVSSRLPNVDCAATPLRATPQLRVLSERTASSRAGASCAPDASCDALLGLHLGALLARSG